MIESGALGKKVFFLYPPPVLTEIVDELARREFEVYLAHDHQRLSRALAKSPDSLLFINIDDELDEPGWVSYIDGLRSNAETKCVGVGILTLNDRPPEVRQTYLMDLQVSCGFIVLKIGAAKTTEILVKTLEANEARGRRKFVRALCPPGWGQCALNHEGSQLRAMISDLSSAGMAVKFDGDLSLRTGSILRDVTLTVKGSRLTLSGFVAAQRMEADGSRIHVVMFDPASLDDTRKERLKSLVFKVNQGVMSQVLELA
ncbi:MAG TPA: PilZ domain-containing protein [Rectinemataceae bacterium]|nr:PilZ domain-containing protein [Rectinemataceae bacterium]